MPRVLLLGSADRAALAICRSLGRSGIECTIARLGRPSVAERSRYATEVLGLGNAALDVEASFQRLEKHLDRRAYDLLIPVNDAACEISMAYRERLEGHVKIALPGADSYRLAHDKRKTLELARIVGVATPAYRTISSLAELDAFQAVSSEKPYYVKPIHSCRLIGNQLIGSRVAKVLDFEQMADYCRRYLASYPVMIQEVCPGRGTGVYLLAWQGAILTMLEQLRLHEPIDGGGSSYRISVELEPDLRRAAAKLVAATNWSGVAMIEFKGSEGSWSLMEMNGRFWGSTALTVSAGLDLPRWLYELYAGQAPPGHFVGRVARVGVRQRHLVKDLGWLLREMRRSPKKMRTLLGWLAELRFLLLRSERLDSEQRGDLGPALAEWRAVLAGPARALQKRVRRQLAFLRYVKDRDIRLEEAAERMARGAPKLLFVCRGNIFRSAFADAYAKQRWYLPTVRSAGTYPQPNRLVPVVAETIARERFGVGLEDHRSRVLDRALLDWAELILVMDSRTLAAVEEHGPGKAPVVMLGDLAGEGQIKDPNGKTAPECRQVFAQIAASLDALMNQVGSLRPAA